MSKKLSLCITTYNRFGCTIKSFAKVIDDERIDEVIIVDDASTDNSYESLCLFFKNEPKVKLYRNEVNLGMSRNKAKAIELATNEWCILFDSDNVLDKTYLDALPDDFDKYDNTIYMPESALPNFDFKRFSGYVFTRHNVREYMHRQGWDVLFNTCNYVVNRAQYLSVYQYNKDMRGTDTLWFNYLWMAANNWLSVVPGMCYNHVVHSGSGWLADADYNLERGKEINQLIKQL